MDDEELKLLLGMQFEGLEDAVKYASSLRDLTKVENQLSRAVERVNEQLRMTKELTQGLSLPSFTVNNFATAPNAPRRQTATEAAPAGTTSRQEPTPNQVPRISGPNARFEKALNAYEWARKEGSGAEKKDSNIELVKAFRALETSRSAMTPEMQALYSTRVTIPGTGASPLLGKTMEAAIGKDATRGVLAGLAPVMKAFGPLGMALGLTKDGLQALYQSAVESARITNQLTAGQATSGGSIADIARVGLIGGSPEAARAAQDRITNDPQAMSAASRLGVVNLKGQYGNLDWTKQYLMLIERTAAIADASQRRRLALTLGIEQEVARYSLLSEGTRKALKHSADITGRINDPRAQYLSAEFEANRKIMDDSLQNLNGAIGQLFSEDMVESMTALARMANRWAERIKAFEGVMKPINNAIELLPGGQFLNMIFGKDSMFTPAGNARRAKEKLEAGSLTASGPMTANTLALRENTEAMARLNGTITGGGQRTREALPSALRGPQLYEAMMSGQLRTGGLG